MKSEERDPIIVAAPRLGVAADHGGFTLKEFLASRLRSAGYAVIDFGNWQDQPNDDYPDFVVPLAHAIARNEVTHGVAICGTGVGMAIVANKVRGVRACLISDTFSACKSVEDDDLNMMCLGGRVIGQELAWELARTFLKSRYSGTERHVRRLAKIANLEARK